MLDDLLGIAVPSGKKPGWNKAWWGRGIIALVTIASGLAGIYYVFLMMIQIGDASLRKEDTTLNLIALGVGMLAVMLIPPMLTRTMLWHLIVKRIASQANRPHTPASAKRTGKSIPPAHELSPEELENEIAWILQTLSKTGRAELTGGQGDEGIDIKLFDQAGMLKTIVQVKRLRPDAYCKPTHLRDLDSCRRRLGVSKALLATTGRFSQKTTEDAATWNINLWDGAKIEEYRKKAYTLADSSK